MEESGSGRSSSNTRAASDGPPAGQFTAPMPAGMKANVRSVSARNRSSQGSA